MYKRPADILDYTLNWADWLGPSRDTILDVEYTLPASSQLTKITESNTDTTTTVWLSGGKKGRYELICVINTVGGTTQRVPYSHGGFVTYNLR